MKLFIIFILLNVLNVIIQTSKSLLTVNGSKIVASIANAVAYGFYTVVLVYMNCDLNLWVKVVVVALCNLIGVYVVKITEEKMQKEKLWKVELTAKSENTISAIKSVLSDLNIPFSILQTYNSEYYLFNIYCKTKKQSQLIKDITKEYKVKYFVSETKNL